MVLPAVALIQRMRSLARRRAQAAVELRHGLQQAGAVAAVAAVAAGPAHPLAQARHRLRQAFAGHRLEQVIDGAQVEGLQRMAVVGGGEHDTAGAAAGAGHFQPADTGHADVEEGDVRTQARDR